MPGFVRRPVDFWHDIILQNHSLRGTLVSCLGEGAGLDALLLREYSEPSIDWPYDVGQVPEAVLKKRFPPAFAIFWGPRGACPCRSWVCREVD